VTKVPIELIPQFQTLERQLKAMGLYTGPIDDDWGSGVDKAIARLRPAPPAAPPQPNTLPLRYPRGYEWLGNIGLLPRTISEGLPLIGVLEDAGKANDPTIMAWAKETGLANVYTADAVPWCGLFAAVVAGRAGYKKPTNPLWALNWAKFGVEAAQPCLGYVLAFQRKGGGHVGFYIGEDKDAYHVLGGNQSDSVSIARIAKNRLYAVRRPNWNTAPASSKPYILASGGGRLSTNEA
jgi:uncharacterized protein (TIGR02594 family)